MDIYGRKEYIKYRIDHNSLKKTLPKSSKFEIISAPKTF